MRLASRTVRGSLVAVVAVAAVLAVLVVLALTGVVWPNRVFAARYDVRGLDVSRYQGAIDWPRLAEEDLDFVWIKATEGSTQVDADFTVNWAGAERAGLLRGAYHFLSFETSGAAQARHFIDIVPAVPGMLPPVVDVEPYGRFKDHLPSAARVREILDPLLDALQAHYGVPPILYVTGTSYQQYVEGAYPDDPIWFRSVITPARVPGGRRWTLWQYSDRDHLAGLGPLVDRDVFRGTRSELEALTLPR